MARQMIILALLSVFCTSPATAADDGFLKRRGAELYLNGKPFYEISFNIYDLVWRAVDPEFANGEKTGYGDDPNASVDATLRELSGFGFKTIRVFCGMPAAYFDPGQRVKYLATLDRMLDDCDRYDLRVVFCLRAEESYFGKACGEETLDTVMRPDSKSRALLNEFVRALVLRYRDRKTIAMWEHANEMLLMADIGGKERVWNGIKVPTLTQVAKFHEELAAFIRKLDARHLITTGDSFRFSQWHLHQGVLGEETNSWGLDTIGEMAKAWAMTQKHTDLFCAHYYNFRAKGENEVMGAGGIPVPCVPGDLKRMATAAGYPLYLGEFGVLPGRGMKKADKFLVNNPDWFTSFTDDRQQAAKIIQPALQSVLEAHVNLTHWWNYGSERDQNDIAWKRNPDLVRLVIEANRKLQMENMGFTYMKELSAK